MLLTSSFVVMLCPSQLFLSCAPLFDTNFVCHRTLGLIKPDAFEKFNHILEAIYDNGFRVTNLKMCQLSRQEAGAFYQEHQSKSFYK